MTMIHNGCELADSVCMIMSLLLLLVGKQSTDASAKRYVLSATVREPEIHQVVIVVCGVSNIIDIIACIYCRIWIIEYTWMQ